MVVVVVGDRETERDKDRHIGLHTDKQTESDRQRDQETGRRTDRDRDRQTERGRDFDFDFTKTRFQAVAWPSCLFLLISLTKNMSSQHKNNHSTITMSIKINKRINKLSKRRM